MTGPSHEPDSQPPRPLYYRVLTSLFRWTSRVPALLGGLFFIGLGALLLSSFWRLGYPRWQERTAAEVPSERAPGQVEGFWWRLDFRPELLGPTGTNWQALTSPELCVRFRWRHPSAGDTPGVACRRYPRLWDNLSLLSAELAPGLPLAWLDDEGGARMELRLSGRAHGWLSEHTPFFWPLVPQTESARRVEEKGSEVEALWIAIDRPVSHMIESWSRPREPIEVVYEPAAPSRARPAAMERAVTDARPEQVFVVLLGIFGFVTWSMGWVALLFPFAWGSRWVAGLIALAGLAALPLWGGRVGELAGRVSPQAESFFTWAEEALISSPPFLEVRDPGGGPAPGDVVLPYSLATSFYAGVLTPLELRRPEVGGETGGGEDEVLRALAASTAEQVLAWPEAEQVTLFHTLTDSNHRDRTEVGYLFLEAARRVGLDGESTAAGAALRYLRSFAITPPHRDGTAFQAKVEQWRALVGYPDTIVSNIARITLEQVEPGRPVEQVERVEAE